MTGKDVIINLDSGIFFLHKPIIISEDNYPSEASITFSGKPGKTIISGGYPIKSFESSANSRLDPKVKGKVFESQIPAGLIKHLRQLWYNGIKMDNASIFDSFELPRIIGVDKSKKELYVPRIDRQFSNPAHLEAFIIQDWVTNVMRIDSIIESDTESILKFKEPESEIEFKRPWPILRADRKSDTNHFYILRNAIELLDRPGEWYYEPATSILYFYPLQNNNIFTCGLNNDSGSFYHELILPVTETLFEIEGTIDKPLHSLRFEGITFCNTTWLRPSEEGHVPLQAGMYILDAYSDSSAPGGNVAWVGRQKASITVSNAIDCSIHNCYFRNTGAGAIDLIEGVKDSSITGCSFYDIGGNAITVGFFGDKDFEVHCPYNPENQAILCDSIEISNNYIHSPATEDWGCVAICTGYASDIIIRNNEIINSPYSAISMGWGWTEEPNCMHDNVILDNYIKGFGIHMNDCGAIYTLSSQPNSRIEGNYIIEPGTPMFNPLMWEMPHAQFDIYTDEGSDHFIVRNNMCKRGDISRNRNGKNNIWGTNNTTVDSIFLKNAGLTPNYQYLRNTVSDKDKARTATLINIIK